MKKLLGALCLVLAAQAGFAADETGTTSVFSKNQKFDNEGVELYENNLDLKSVKRIGVGLAAGGMTGLIGLNAEFNMEPENALFVGLGTGAGFNSFNIGWKRNFEGYYLSPYTKVGYSRWYNSTSGGQNDGKMNDILKRVLSDEELSDNRFSVNFIQGSLGLEYNQLEGGLSGVNLFGELQLLSDLDPVTLVPTASIGITYFY